MYNYFFRYVEIKLKNEFILNNDFDEDTICVVPCYSIFLINYTNFKIDETMKVNMSIIKFKWK